jgi:hypothetical protein
MDIRSYDLTDVRALANTAPKGSSSATVAVICESLTPLSSAMRSGIVTKI